MHRIPLGLVQASVLFMLPRTPRLLRGLPVRRLAALLPNHVVQRAVFPRLPVPPRIIIAMILGLSMRITMDPIMSVKCALDRIFPLSFQFRFCRILLRAVCCALQF